jgi:hypothetical protein
VDTTDADTAKPPTHPEAAADGIGYAQGFNERLHVMGRSLFSRALWRKAGRNPEKKI